MIRPKNTLCTCLLLGWSPLALAQAPVAAVGNAQIDPQTGQLTTPAQPQQLILSPDEQNRMSSSHEGLREQALPGGGYSLDLQGRFQHSMFATVTSEGQVRIDHNLPGSNAVETPHATH